jgi:probable phosphoglycerate mutase
MRVRAVRHGESEYNLLGLCNDDPSRPVHLTARGRVQAAAAAEQLTIERVDAIYASPLPRARETAALIGEHLGLAVTLDDRLADIRSGCEGRPVAEYQAAIAHDPRGHAVNPHPLRNPASRLGPARAIHGTGVHRTTKVHRTFRHGSPLEA